MMDFRKVLAASALAAIMVGNSGCFLLLFRSADDKGSTQTQSAETDEDKDKDER